MRSVSAASIGVLLVFAACSKSTIRVVGVMHQSSEMRPLPSVPLAGYQQLRVLVHALPAQSAVRYGSPDCGFAIREGSDEGEDLKNAACVPVEASNDAVTIVRQRLRSYGIAVVRDASEPHDYKVDVSVTGEAPRKPDPTLAKAVATVTFQIHPSTGNTLVSGIDTSAAAAAFDSVAKSCRLKDATLSSFAASNTQPMTPDFDIIALAGGAVDNLLRCYDLARFFLDAPQRFAKANATEAAPSPRNLTPRPPSP